MKDLIANAPEYEKLGEGLEPKIPETPKPDPNEDDPEGKNSWWFSPDEEKAPWEKGPKITRTEPEDDPDINKTFIHPGDFLKTPLEEDIPDSEEPPEWYGELLPLKPKRPLIVVPGIMGTNLGMGTKQIWPPFRLRKFELVSLEELLKNTKKIAPMNTNRGDKKSNARSYADGSSFVSGAYTGLMRFLIDGLKYELGKDLFTFGYNWTLSNSINGGKLAGFITYIEKNFEWGNTPEKDRKVDIMCHSMGGLVTRAALRLYGKQAKRVVYMASPHYGTPAPYALVQPKIDPVPGIGADIALFFAEYFTNITDKQGKDVEKLLHDASKIVQSIHELLPDKFLFRKNESFVTKKILTTTPGTKFITSKEEKVKGLDNTYYNDTHSAFPKKPVDVQALTKKAMAFKESLGFALPGDSYLNIAGVLGKTKSNAILGATNRITAEKIGDGTVILDSALGPGYFNKVRGEHTDVPNIAQTHILIALYWASTN